MYVATTTITNGCVSTNKIESVIHVTCMYIIYSTTMLLLLAGLCWLIDCYLGNYYYCMFSILNVYVYHTTPHHTTMTLNYINNCPMEVTFYLLEASSVPSDQPIHHLVDLMFGRSCFCFFVFGTHQMSTRLG